MPLGSVASITEAAMASRAGGSAGVDFFFGRERAAGLAMNAPERTHPPPAVLRINDGPNAQGTRAKKSTSFTHTSVAARSPITRSMWPYSPAAPLARVINCHSFGPPRAR